MPTEQALLPLLRGWSPRRARRTQRRRRHPSSWSRGVLRDLLRAVDSARDLRPDSLRVTRRFHSRRGLLRCREALETVLDVVEQFLHKTTIIGSFAFARLAIIAFNALEEAFLSHVMPSRSYPLFSQAERSRRARLRE
ncbi:hypothetical protein EXIGLDRAFT_40892 [Exidia glandulosa HHB12029]|uniref:Uncharacterized protein n=1 Tax=Exidia glandulosa HHB12029 TaxID=1314781 RepID=A0A165IMD8_EXIGL|nr:hypothetical protein EXIGLDRAFT_40892 [Exidia glandulosa HHB12029]